MLKEIMVDLKAYYRKSQGNKKRYSDLKRKKLIEVEIHEVITRLGNNLTKSGKLAFSLLDSYFYEDLMEYIIHIAKNKRFIDDIHVKRKKPKEEVAKITQSIVENTLCVVNNVFYSEGETITRAFMDMVNWCLTLVCGVKSWAL
jgi:hypothetical protein